jgi:hypothetical protein
VPSPHLAAEELVPLIPATAYRPINVSADTSWGLTRTVRIPGVGQVRLVVSCEHASVTGRSVLLVTHRLDWSAAKMISLSSQRWPTATFDQDSKGYLGCNEYRMRRAAAIGTHGCLVVVASALWPLTCLPAGPERTKGLIHTLGDACRQQGRAVLQRRLRFVHDPWSHGTTVAQVFTQFFAKQQGTVLV